MHLAGQSARLAALAEARRVLKLGGQLVVVEHVRGEGKLARRQDRWDSVWSRFGAGCHPNRDTRAAIERAGFTFDELEQFAELPRWVLTRTMLQGTPPGSAASNLHRRRHMTSSSANMPLA